ncbi:telomere length regulation protein TEL2 homolog [Aphidius gifuensis]|uniref:telomere length regulation protein TEL2 homolog n=1 Tax=Aphidius gifuensis TaxID=684658 RepID=UPI001CDB61F0|nr:telomere length regulation protein TEL2 homolog [Aphidius gifuensis]
MEEAYNQLLEYLTCLGTIKSQQNIDMLEFKINNYTKYFPPAINHENYAENKININGYYYGKIIESVIEKFDNNWPLKNDNLSPTIKNLMIVDNLSFEMAHEFLIAISDSIQKSKNIQTINALLIIIEKFIKNDSLLSAILDVSRPNNNSDIINEEINKNWKNFLQLLVSLPSKIANKIQGKMPKTFMIDNYSKIISYHYVRAVLFLNDIKNKLNIQPNVKMLSMVISKIVLTLGSSYCVELIDILMNWSLEDKNNINSFVQMIYLNLEKSSIEYVANMLLQMTKHPEQVCKMFGNLIENDCWKHILTLKIPLFGYNDDDMFIVNLITYLSSDSVDKDILMNLLKKLLDIWGDRSALNHTPLEQHEYITKLILFSMKKLKNNINSDDKMILQKLIFSGTEAHLENMKIEIRAIGMITGEIIFGLLTESSDEPKLNYEYDNMPKLGKDIVDKIKKFFDCNFEIKDLNKNSGIKKDLIKELGLKCQILSEINEVDCLKKETNGSTSIVEEEKAKSNTDVQQNSKDIDDGDESDLDSDDDLVPYDMSNDTKISEKLRPVYLRDLRDILVNHNSNSDPDKFGEALAYAEDLISSHLPNDDPSLAIELLEILSTLNEISYVENFNNLKFNSCVAVVTVHPKQCAEYICREFHSKIGTYSLSTRIFFLQVLAESAKRLSSIKNLNVPDENPNKMKAIKYRKSSKPASIYIDITSGKKCETLYDEDIEVIDDEDDDDSSKNWHNIVQQRIQSNTKILTHKTKLPETTMNKFNDVASYFFYPLLYGLSQKEACMFKKPKSFEEHDTILLIQFLKTLSAIMIAAENCVIATKMGLEILELAWTLRYHEQAKVRLCIIENIASVIVSISRDNFTNEIIELLMEFRMWLYDVSQDSLRGDPDTNCRSLGKHVVQLIDSVISSTMESND